MTYPSAFINDEIDLHLSASDSLLIHNLLSKKKIVKKKKQNNNENFFYLIKLKKDFRKQ